MKLHKMLMLNVTIFTSEKLSLLHCLPAETTGTSAANEFLP